MTHDEWLETFTTNLYFLQERTGEKFVRQYRAFEGDWRVITETRDGRQKRYTITEDGELVEKL